MFVLTFSAGRFLGILTFIVAMAATVCVVVCRVEPGYDTSPLCGGTAVAQTTAPAPDAVVGTRCVETTT
jgi:hypothetical protein